MGLPTKSEVDLKAHWLFKQQLFDRIGYYPHEGQKLIHFSEWVYHVAVWGRRSGKTAAAYFEILAELALPNRRVWIAAPNYGLTDKVFREVWRLVVEEKVLGDCVVQKSFTRDSRKIVTKWGSWIEGKSCDSPDSLVGEGLDLLVIDEAAKVPPAIWEKYLEPTLVDRKGRALMISTPEGHNWLYDAWLRGQKEETRDYGWRSSRLKSADNPHLDKEWIEAKKQEVTPEIYRQEYEASFEHHTGLVYHDFKDLLFPSGHLFNDNQVVIRPDWTHYRSIDPGLANPTSCIWAAVDEDGNVFIYDEYEVADVLADVHAANIIAKTRYPVLRTFIDPAAHRSSATDRNSVAKVFRASGIPTKAASRDVTAGIQIVARYLRSTLDANSAHPKVFIHERCINLRRSLNRLVWDENSTLYDKNSPDRPRKYDDHSADALRYLLSSNVIHVPFRSHVLSPPSKVSQPTVQPKTKWINVPRSAGYAA